MSCGTKTTVEPRIAVTDPASAAPQRTTDTQPKPPASPIHCLPGRSRLRQASLLGKARVALPAAEKERKQCSSSNTVPRVEVAVDPVGQKTQKAHNA